VNPYFLIAALADLTAVAVHGYIGHRAFLTPLTAERLFPTREFGNAERTRRVLMVSWHAVTAAFASSGLMMILLASGAVTSRPAALFLSGMHASFLLVGVAVGGGRISTSLKPIPIAFFTCMTTVILMGWLGGR
jgi:hypothetical protein